MWVKCALKVWTPVQCTLLPEEGGDVKCLLTQASWSLVQCDLLCTTNGFQRKHKLQTPLRPSKKQKKRHHMLKLSVVVEAEWFDLNVDALTSVGELKAMVKEKLPEVINDRCVYFSCGKKLKNENSTMEEYGIKDGATLQVGVKKKVKRNMRITVGKYEPYVRTKAPKGNSGLFSYIDHFEANEEMYMKRVKNYLASLGEEEYEEQLLSEEELENVHKLTEGLWNREGPPLLPDYIKRTKLARPCKGRQGFIRWFPEDRDIGEQVYYAAYEELPETLPKQWAEDIWGEGSVHIEDGSQLYEKNKKRWFSYGLFNFYFGEEDNLMDDAQFARGFRGMVKRVVGDLYDEQLLNDVFYTDYDINMQYEQFSHALLSGCMYYYAPL